MTWRETCPTFSLYQGLQTGRNDKAMHCPKCRGVMRTYTRSGVQIEQCDNCRGIFLDYGELEALAQMEAQYRAAPPPAAAPGWGAPAPAVHHHHHGGHHRPHHGSVFNMLFSS